MASPPVEPSAAAAAAAAAAASASAEQISSPCPIPNLRAEYGTSCPLLRPQYGSLLPPGLHSEDVQLPNGASDKPVHSVSIECSLISSDSPGEHEYVASSRRRIMPFFGGDKGAHEMLPTNGCNEETIFLEDKFHEIPRGLTLTQRTHSADRQALDLHNMVAVDNFELKTPPTIPEKGAMHPFISATKKDEDSSFFHHITHIDGIFENNVECDKDEKLKAFAGEPGLPKEGTSSEMQATLNCVSLLFGLGILSSPYAVASAGWMGAIISIIIATTYAYTSYLIIRCVKFHPELTTYQDVAKMALGRRTRVLITALFYIEITGTLVGYSISVGDNLSYIFPSSKFSMPGLSNRNFMIFVASLCILPTVWLRDLSALSFTSMWCIASTILLLVAVCLAATVNHIGFTHPIPFLRLEGVPVAAGLYAFSYGGTSVFPSIYKSMKDPSKFTRVLVVSFVIATASIAGLGIAGAAMFGAATNSQITLSMPSSLVATKIVLWMTVLTPMFKFALLLSPITTALEKQLHRRWKSSPTMQFGMGTLMRSSVLAAIAIVAMVLPYFNYIVALIGSSMTISICMILPCIFYIKICYSTLRIRTLVMIITLVSIGVIAGMCGTVVSFKGLITGKKSQTSS